MNIKEKAKKYWETKSVWNKISDAIFIIILLSLLHPTSRMEVISFVKQLTSFAPSEIKKEDRVAISKTDYDWQFETMDGEIISLNDFAGKTILINQWATWCPPCVAEMPSIQKLYDKVKDSKKAAFVIVTNEKREVVEQFIKKRGFTFPVVMARSATPKVFQSSSIPVSFVISPQGEILIKEYGSKKWHTDETVKMFQ